MRVTTKIQTLTVITGFSVLVSTGASAWWSDNDDYWDGPWGYPGYGYDYPGYGWGGYPGYGWDGYPGYGWGGYPGWGQQAPRRIEIYTGSQESRVPQGYSVK